jgi:hypothetical protein
MADKGNANVAKVYACMGATGCGKSTWLRSRLATKKRRRTIFWSPKEAVDNYAAFYPGTIICRTSTEVLTTIQAAGAKGEFHIVFWPTLNRKVDEKQFHVVCKIALAARNVTMVVDELHTVTRASWAPDGWSELVMMGRGFGAELFGMSQRPAGVDKDFMGNASLTRTGRLNFPADAEAVAKSLGVKPAEVLALTGYQWIERDNLTGKVSRG